MSATKYEYQGHHGLPAIAKAFGINAVTLTKRIQRGLTIEQAVKIPVGTVGQRLAIEKPLTPKYVRGVWPVSITPLWKIALGLENAK